MIFEALYKSAELGELTLVDNGYCRWHLRRDGQITIGEIIVTKQGCGIGTAMLEKLKCVQGATSIFAKCPSDLPANRWYERRGFTLESVEYTKSGRELKLWRLYL
jgi:hypothetical protein